MTPEIPFTSLELRSLVTEMGMLALSLIDVPVPVPRPGQVLIRVEAAPINPSDLGLFVRGRGHECSNGRGYPCSPRGDDAALRGRTPGSGGRVGRSLPVGNEGAGTVVAVGDSPEAQDLMGRTVSAAGGGMYTQYRASEAVSVPRAARRDAGQGGGVIVCQSAHRARDGRDDAPGGSQRSRPHGSGSNLGQMLVKLCLEEDVPLVNIARRPEQASSCDPSAPSMSATPARRRSSLISGTLSPPRRPRSPSTPPVEGISPVRSSAPWKRRPPNPPRSTRGTGRPFASRCTSTEALTRARPS